MDAKLLELLSKCNRQELDAIFKAIKEEFMQELEEQYDTQDREELKTKINGELDDEPIYGFGPCPICGSTLGWGSSAMRDECGGAPEGDSSVVNFLSCGYCGASVDVYECLDEEKQDYTYWVEREKKRKEYDQQDDNTSEGG